MVLCPSFQSEILFDGRGVSLKYVLIVQRKFTGTPSKCAVSHIMGMVDYY